VAKYGVQAYNDAIRMELEMFGVKCCLLEPGIFHTGLIDEEAMRQRVESVWKGLSGEVKREYGEEYKENCECFGYRIGNEPDDRRCGV